MGSLYICLNGTFIKINSNYDKYFGYLSDYFNQVKVDNNFSNKVDLEINISWVSVKLKEMLKDRVANGFMQIGANTYIKDNKIVTVREIQRHAKTVVSIENQTHKTVIDAFFHKKPLKNLWRFGLKKRPYEEWFAQLTYFLVYYPLFWHLSKKRSFYPLHASSMIYKDKSLVICGMEGQGKTSLALKFLQEDGGQYLSDNITFYDETRVQPCYELIRIHEGEKDGLWEKNFERMNESEILKGFFYPKVLPKSDPIKPAIFIFPEFSDHFFIQKIGTKKAVGLAVNLSYIPTELHDFVEFKHLVNILNPEYNSWDYVYDALTKLLENVKCYRVQMSKNEGIDKSFQRIKESDIWEK